MADTSGTIAGGFGAAVKEFKEVALDTVTAGGAVLSAVIVLLVGFYFVIIVGRSACRDPRPTLLPLSVPADVAAKGFSGDVVRALILDEVNRIQRHGRSSDMTEKDIKLQGFTYDLVIPFSGGVLSHRHLAGIIRDIGCWLGICEARRQIAGEITVQDGLFFATLRKVGGNVIGARLGEQEGVKTVPEAICRAAEALVERYDYPAWRRWYQSRGEALL